MKWWRFAVPINDPYYVDQVQMPRARVLTAGIEISGVISMNVTSNNYFQSDGFRVSFALNPSKNFNAAWWGDPTRQQIILDIQASVDGGQTWTSLIIGQVDHISIIPEQGLCEVDGRDLTAYFIGNKTQDTFINKTSSQVAELLAERRGLIADVTPTTTLVGRYYSDDHDRMTPGQFVRTTTEWNLLCSLAQHEQFDVYVTGRTLHFHPTTPPDSDPYLVIWQPNEPWSNTVSMHLQRSMYMAKDVQVVVRSWNSRSGRAVTKTSGFAKDGKAQIFSFVVPNLTEAEAQDLANRKRAEITKHERLFEFTRPADLILQPRMLVKIQGFGAGWDQALNVDSVSRTMDFESGFTMSVRTKSYRPSRHCL